MKQGRPRVVRWVVTAVAVAVLTVAAALAIFDHPAPTPSLKEPPKPHCSPHGVVPAFVRPGCD